MTRLKIMSSLVLGLFALMNLARGGVHVFSSDGGAGSIAGLDLSTSSATIVPLFALIGVSQISAGLFEAFLLAFRRDLITLGLAFQALMTTGAVLVLQVWRPLPVEVPGEAFNTALLPIVVVAWLASLAADRKG